jgi:hypothetical protein
MNTSGEPVARDEGGSHMAAAVIQEPEAPEAACITQVEDLPDPVRADIVARRQNGETLAELKTRFAHVDPAVIREVLPPANARERKAREAKSKVTDTKQGVGGRSGEAKSEPKARQANPKPAPEPRYAANLGDLPAASWSPARRSGARRWPRPSPSARARPGAPSRAAFTRARSRRSPSRS